MTEVTKYLSDGTVVGSFTIDGLEAHPDSGGGCAITVGPDGRVYVYMLSSAEGTLREYSAAGELTGTFSYDWAPTLPRVFNNTLAVDDQGYLYLASYEGTYVFDVGVVPEPTTASLVVLGGLALMGRRRR